MASGTPSVSDLITDFFRSFINQVVSGVCNFRTNLYTSFADVSFQRWMRILAVVACYVAIRPYIDRFFRWTYERDLKKREAKKAAEAEAFGMPADERVRKSANALRGGESEKDGEPGEDFATASGVPEWSRNARKRQKKYLRSVMEREAGTAAAADELSEEQVMELLDWSESEVETEVETEVRIETHTIETEE